MQLNSTGEVLGNPTGGVKQGATNEGLFEMSVDGDLYKIAGLNGAIESYFFSVKQTVYQISASGRS